MDMLVLVAEGDGSIAETYVRGLSSSKSPAVRQGSAAALGVLPCQLLMPCWRECLAALGQACQVCRLTWVPTA